MQKDKHFISFIKGISWRVIGTLDTITLSYIFTGSVGSALKIGATEVFTKIFLFYLHERVWFRVKWGLTRKESHANLTTEEVANYKNKDEIWQESHLRSAIKGISWRVVGTLDTIIIATFWTGDYSKAMKIGFTEVITKITLYYFHERIWMHYTRNKPTNNAEVINNESVGVQQ